MGARPLRRAIQRYIEDPLADEVLRTEIEPGSTVMVDVDSDSEDEEKPLKLTIIKPDRKPEPEPVGVAAAKDEGAEPDEPAEGDGEPGADA